MAGTRRTYLITPPTVAAADDATRVPAPLVLLFHGFAGSARQISALTDLPTKAAAQGMFAVVPDGTSGTWGTPDTPFVEALIDHIERTRCIDVRRVFATGFSAGAAFAISFACGHPSQIAAIAPVAVDLPLGCVRPTSILAFHGTADPMVSYRAGPGGLSLPGADLPGTEADMVAWARLGRCNPTATVTRLGTEVVRKSWTGCAAGTDVALYRIEGGGHAWPGGDPKQSVGPTTRQVDASDQILAFFAGHHQPPDH